MTTEEELNSYSSRGDDNIVDWQLSREFAELWLEDGIADGEYPSDASLWEIPIAIYNSDGDIKYYEFRVVSDGEVVGYITGTATKDYSCPIVFEGKSSGIYDELTELYNSGKLDSDNIPRLVDDDYPSIKVGVTNETRGDAVNFNSYLSLDGEEVNEDCFVL